MQITMTADRHVPALGRLVRAGADVDVDDRVGEDLVAAGVAKETKPPAKAKTTTKATANGADEPQEN